MLGRLTYVRRVNVPLARVPRHVRAAFIAVEDRRFYYHHGVDWRSAARALVRNIARADVSEGFSTITMQVVRNAFVPQLAQRRTLRRKLIEIYLAYRLERSLTKQQILALYLNVIYLGNGAYGVEAASRDLFGKRRGSAHRGRGRDAGGAGARTVGLRPAAASRPRGRAAQPRARRDGARALSDRLARGARALAAPLRLAPSEWRPREDRSFAIDPVRAVVDSVLGDDQQGDLIVYTTLDARAQRSAESAVRRQADAIDAHGGHRDGPRHAAGRAGRARSAERRDSRPGGRAPLRPRRVQSRARRAAAAGLRLQAVRLRRGPGEGAHAGRGRDGHAGRDRRARRRVAPGQLRRALRGPPDAAPRAHALGQRGDRPVGRGRRASGGSRPSPAARASGARSPRCPSLALGAGEVTPLELVAAYAPFANGGVQVTPSLVRRIEAGDGTVLWRAPARKAERVLGAAEAFQLTSMLESVVDGGTGRALRDLRRPRGGGGQDRHDQRRHRRVVRRLHAHRGGGGLVRVRRAETDRALGLGRPPRGARVGGVLPGRLVRARAGRLGAARRHS